MKIGLISDTHGWLDPAVFRHFEPCSEIWHAGDIGPEVSGPLEAFRPLIAVYGNIDDRQIRNSYPKDQWIERDGLTILITHIAGNPPGYTPEVRRMTAERKPDVLICGHSHIVRASRHEWLHLNPGAAGRQGFHRMRTIMRMDITGGKIENLEVIELGLRGAL